MQDTLAAGHPLIPPPSGEVRRGAARETEKLVLFATLFFACFIAYAPPAKAGVYVTDAIDPISAFCQAVATTKDAYCPRVRVDCRLIKKKQSAAFIKAARQCNDDPNKIKPATAQTLMGVYPMHQNVLCCTSLRK